MALRATKIPLSSEHKPLNPFLNTSETTDRARSTWARQYLKPPEGFRDANKQLQDWFESKDLFKRCPVDIPRKKRTAYLEKKFPQKTVRFTPKTLRASTWNNNNFSALQNFIFFVTGSSSNRLAVQKLTKILRFSCNLRRFCLGIDTRSDCIHNHYTLLLSLQKLDPNVEFSVFLKVDSSAFNHEDNRIFQHFFHLTKLNKLKLSLFDGRDTKNFSNCNQKAFYLFLMSQKSLSSLSLTLHISNQYLLSIFQEWDLIVDELIALKRLKLSFNRTLVPRALFTSLSRSRKQIQQLEAFSLILDDNLYFSQNHVNDINGLLQRMTNLRKVEIFADDHLKGESYHQLFFTLGSKSSRLRRSSITVRCLGQTEYFDCTPLTFLAPQLSDILLEIGSCPYQITDSINYFIRKSRNAKTMVLKLEESSDSYPHLEENSMVLSEAKSFKEVELAKSLSTLVNLQQLTLHFMLNYVGENPFLTRLNVACSRQECSLVDFFMNVGELTQLTKFEVQVNLRGYELTDELLTAIGTAICKFPALESLMIGFSNGKWKEGTKGLLNFGKSIGQLKYLTNFRIESTLLEMDPASKKLPSNHLFLEFLGDLIGANSSKSVFTAPEHFSSLFCARPRERTLSLELYFPWQVDDELLFQLLKMSHNPMSRVRFLALNLKGKEPSLHSYLEKTKNNLRKLKSCLNMISTSFLVGLPRPNP